MSHSLKFWFYRLFSILDDEIGFFAASLSFYSVLSIIPMFWVLFFILQQLGVVSGYYELVQSLLANSLIPSHAETIVMYLQKFMGNAKRMGVIGLVYIVVTSVLFYKNYQYVVNRIFLVPNHSLLHGVATYLVLAILMPLTLGASIYLSDYIQRVAGGGEVLVFGPFAMISYIMIWLLFFVLYTVSPNMRISMWISIRVSFVASLVWHLAKWLFVEYLVANQMYTTLYGSFSVLLFLLVWIYLSWLLLLHGLKACYIMHCRKATYR